MKKEMITIFSGALLFVMAIVVVIMSVVDLLNTESDSIQFDGLNPVEYSVNEPGDYYLWNDYQTVYEGRTYRRSDEIPDGLEIKVFNAGGKELVVTSATGVSMTRGEYSRKSIAYVTVAKAQKLTVQLSGNLDGRIYSFGSSNVLEFILQIFMSFAIAAVMSVAGIALIVFGAVKLSKQKADSSAVA